MIRTDNMYEKKKEQYVNLMSTEASPAVRKSLGSGSCTALAFLLGDDLRKVSISSSSAVALSSGFGVKQFMMKHFAASDMHSGTLGWILNMPTLMGSFKGLLAEFEDCYHWQIKRSCSCSFKQLHSENVCFKREKTDVAHICPTRLYIHGSGSVKLCSCYGNYKFLTCK